jgi:hypothetical protein
MKALIFKELREIVGLAAIALGCYLMLVFSLMRAKVFDWIPGMPKGTSGVPFINEGFMTPFTFLAVLFAVALGFRQSAWESSRGTFLYLLHLPRSRESIFLVKLVTGLSVFVVCTSVPIVVYAMWASLPGRIAAPFEWSMTESAWQRVIVVSVMYFGAFLSGLRPGWWFGSRLLPLAASALFALLLGWVPWWWLAGWPMTTVVCAVLVSNVCYVARVRDYA